MNIACLGVLWKPARLIDTDDGPQLDVWILQPGGALPVVASRRVDPLDAEGQRELADIEASLQRIGTPVIARGFGIHPAIVDSLECLRIGLTSYVGIVPAEERIAA